MSEDIEFRAWDGKFMVYWDALGQYECDKLFAILSRKTRYIPMQFSGFVLNQKIFAGDIINSKHNKKCPHGGYYAGTSGYYPENAKLVTFDKGMFLLDGLPLCDEFPYLLKSYKPKVVGNIYENIELLEPEK